ncbi:unnamed protein product [Didymodactylos carnosus]|uniref:MULE transposase domain-containing protein n=1 Tax=Didymodactylos carnosus TaxID=1234261 RepID=A0A813X3U1_9BILA|nr:unnamed protein product [Didymodactylos carnosus]CAF1123692.1 unnamed protein product [Didymodactylos carnosus]CAF3653597.1 unnamed protein product [Didymodactylos carnosus]CAF3899644.1 unnamed protein product [Didymodactylos carnosus]
MVSMHIKTQFSAHVDQAISGVKRKAVEDPKTPIQQVYNDEVIKFRQYGTASAVPVFDYIRPTAYRKRQSVLPPLPKSISSIVVPPPLKITSMGQPFLFCDTPRNHKILDFASPDAIRFLGKSLDDIAGSIHAWNDLSKKSLVFVAMPNKFGKLYKELLRSLVRYADSLSVTLAPRSVLIDFEQGALNAFEAVFPGIDVKLCHFHFGQNIWKRIQKHIGIHPSIWNWKMNIQKAEEITAIRVEQEDEQERTSRKRRKQDVQHDIHLVSAKNAFVNDDIDLQEFQRLSRHFAYNYFR